MEIERKFLLNTIPSNLKEYPFHIIEQGYLCVNPVVRIRKSDEEYYLTYKSKGLMVREEYNLPLTKEAYETLRPKVDGHLISKTRYLIPFQDKYTIELDVFNAPHEHITMAEVEFETEEEANSFIPPDWFAEDVTYDSKFHNSYLSQEIF